MRNGLQTFRRRFFRLRLKWLLLTRIPFFLTVLLCKIADEYMKARGGLSLRHNKKR